MRRSSHRLSLSGLLILAGLACLPGSAARAQSFGIDAGINTSFGKNKVQYREFVWKVYHSPHFNVHYYTAEGESLQKVVSFAESAYDNLSRAFNFQIKDPVPLIFYATHTQFEQNNVILNFIPEGVGAFASPIHFRMVLPIDMPDEDLMKLILHELTHVFQYHMLFQGSLAKAVATTPPTWFMEGMASYMAKDEKPRDKMFLRDAVVNDRIPSVTRSDFGGFFAYRFGHAVFDFIEERWGKEGFLDFIFEIRNTIGSRVDRAVKRAFRMDPEDFDVEFRKWLRKQYLPQLVATGEPSDFGKIFRIEDAPQGSDTTSPVASPSGDLVAAITSYKGDIDVVLFDTKKRKMLRNLTSGYTGRYQYLVAQELALGRKMGRDLAFSPDGNSIAAFAKREAGRSLVLLDVLKGGIREVIDMEGLDQEMNPAWSPDGKTVAFAAHKDGRFDLFALDLESRAISNLTHDDVYDAAPSYSPDGKSLAFISVVGQGQRKIFRIDLAQPEVRYQLTTGESNENDPTYSPDGKKLYFTSDRSGVENVFSLDLATGDQRQFSDVVTGASMPTVLHEQSGSERLVYNSFWKGGFDLYVTEVDTPVKPMEKVEIPSTPTQAKDLSKFEPDIQVTLDDANQDKYHGRKFFLEDAQTYIGVNTDQTYLGRIALSFSDYLGNKRIIADLSSIDSFSNFDFTYADLGHRIQWQARVFDDRTFFTTGDFILDRALPRRVEFQQTGAIGSVIYPFSFYQRAEFGLGYIYRKQGFPVLVTDPATGERVQKIREISDDFPIIDTAWVGDSGLFANYGPISGRRWRMGLQYSPDLHDSGTLFRNVTLDFRQYIPLTDRSNLAFRLFAGDSAGNAPSVFYFGGLDSLRGVDFRTQVGDRAYYANAELRFPLIDVLATPLLGFQGIRGVLFFDIGTAYYKDIADLLGGFDFYDSKAGHFVDGVASYGYGFTIRFLGFDLNWDFAKLWRPNPEVFGKSAFTTSFWIGTRF